jgi:nitroimidazol reductase NimA-like FMN-containing flavoprotein (pyridoxamine 5'-phosphate oxidase superfamily)
MNDERTRMRRSDRAMPSDREIEDLLFVAQIGFIATSIEDQPFINPNFYWYDQEHRRIYFHTALEGRTRSNIEQNPEVCFCIAEMGELIPAKEALEFSTEYASVCVFGRSRWVESDTEKQHGLEGLLKKYFPKLHPGKDYRSITADELDKTSVFAIDIDAWSGKQKVKSA